jgi:hypothetical protein
MMSFSDTSGEGIETPPVFCLFGRFGLQIFMLHRFYRIIFIPVHAAAFTGGMALKVRGGWAKAAYPGKRP